MKVGFIGVGNMGGPMCRNIIKNTNHEVIVFDLEAAAMAACTALGASAGASVADVARRCDVVITVTAPAFVQRSRVLRRRGMTPQRLAAMLARQTPDAEKRRRADFVVDTGHGRRHTLQSLAKILRILVIRGRGTDA
jgi:3-hydroxyisobutyrate dehydrogenase-like beta-hydroxyacid dehydrogenase